MDSKKISQAKYTSVFNTLEKEGVNITSEDKDKIEERLNQVCNYEPKVSIFGKCGVGKSNLVELVDAIIY